MRGVCSTHKNALWYLILSGHCIAHGAQTNLAAFESSFIQMNELSNVDWEIRIMWKNSYYGQGSALLTIVDEHVIWRKFEGMF